MARTSSAFIAVVLTTALALGSCGMPDDAASGGQSVSASPSRTASPSASPARLDPTKLQAALDHVRQAGKFPGVIATVYTADDAWVGTAGTAGPAEQRAPAPTDHTRVGSLTKTMTATVLLQLVQEGKLSLEDKIGTYVPGIPNEQATLRQVADMTSGIPSYTQVTAFQQQLFANPTKPWTPEQLIALIRKAKPDFAPGTRFWYSNTNYVLLGLVIEQKTGQQIEQVFAERLFRPLGMKNTQFPTSAALPEPRLAGVTAQGQPEGKTASAVDWNPASAFTAGEVISTLEDLELWAKALFTGEGVLDPQSQRLRRDSLVTDVPPMSPTSGYGIGIGMRNGWWGHDGDIPGYTSSLQHNYNTGTTIIVLTNSDAAFDVSGQPVDPAPAVFAELAAVLQG